MEKTMIKTLTQGEREYIIEALEIAYKYAVDENRMLDNEWRNNKHKIIEGLLNDYKNEDMTITTH